MTTSSKPQSSWRDVLPIHPAADLFPLMSADELKALGEDIKKNGLQSGIVILETADGQSLLDGRNRLDAMELGGLLIIDDEEIYLKRPDGTKGHIRERYIDSEISDSDPYSLAISLNVHRRHLTAQQKREVIAKVLKATPEKSNRQVAEAVKVDHKTVASVRTEKEARGEIPHVEARTDTKGRQQPACKALIKNPAVIAAADCAEVRANSQLIPGVGMAPHAERGLDLYETPPEAVRALLDIEPLSGTIWEPACGPGSIVRVLRAAGHRVVATDIKDYGCPDSRAGIDFPSQSCAPDGAATILTNPPFMDADAFVRHALKLVPRVCMLLRLAFLESQGRSDILDGGQLARVYPFRNRLPMMHRDGWDGPIATSALAFAWYVWDREHGGPAVLSRISWSVDDKRHNSILPDEMPDIPEFLRRSAAP